MPTERLRDRSDQSAELRTQAAVQRRGERGVSDGFETDTNGFVYAGNMEQNEVGFYNPANASVTVFVRDPRISWVDTSEFLSLFVSFFWCADLNAVSVGSDGYLYFTDNQLAFSSSFYPGTDRRERPFVLFRAPLPNNGSRVFLQ